MIKQYDPENNIDIACNEVYRRTMVKYVDLMRHQVVGGEMLAKKGSKGNN